MLEFWLLLTYSILTSPPPINKCWTTVIMIPTLSHSFSHSLFPPLSLSFPPAAGPSALSTWCARCTRRPAAPTTPTTTSSTWSMWWCASQSRTLAVGTCQSTWPRPQGPSLSCSLTGNTRQTNKEIKWTSAATWQRATSHTISLPPCTTCSSYRTFHLRCFFWSTTHAIYLSFRSLFYIYFSAFCILSTFRVFLKSMYVYIKFILYLWKYSGIVQCI